MLKINLKPKNDKHIVVRSFGQRIDLSELVERISYLEFKLKKLESKLRGKI